MTCLDDVLIHLDAIFTRTGKQGQPRRQGLITGEPRQPITRVLLAPMLTPEVGDEAVNSKTDLLMTLDGSVQQELVGQAGVPLRTLIAHNVAYLHASHGRDGVVLNALTNVVELDHARDLLPYNTTEYAVLIVYVPVAEAEELRQALALAGAGEIGDYTGCAWSVTGAGEFTPQHGADPTIGHVGRHEQVEERRLEMVVPIDRIAQVTQALRRAHSYEEPAFSFLTTHPAPGRVGRLKVGELSTPTTAEGLCRFLSAELSSPQLRYSEPNRDLSRIAVGAYLDQEMIETAAAHQADAMLGMGISAQNLALAQHYGMTVIDVGQGPAIWAGLIVLARKLAQETSGAFDVVVSTSGYPQWVTPQR